MKKVFFLISLIVLIFIGINAGKNYTSSVVKSNIASISPSATAYVSASPGINFYPPKYLNIPKLNIQSNVESVGLDSQGRMDVPKKVEDVGWYNLGFKPGQKGSIVLDGHFDDVTGAPAVFYDLSKLNNGDEVSITDESGKIFKYKVIDKQIYDFDKLPLNDIFASTDKARLNLITCDGVFNQNAKNYSKRLVVYSESSD